MEQSKIFKQATSQILNELMKSQELVADTVIDKDSGFAHAFSQLHNYESVVQKNSLALMTIEYQRKNWRSMEVLRCWEPSFYSLWVLAWDLYC